MEPQNVHVKKLLPLIMFVLPWYLDAHYHPNTYQINLT